MKINPEEIEAPLEKRVEYKNGQIEISLAKMGEEKAKTYKEFMATCMNEEDAYVNTKDMDMANAKQACAMYWEKSKDEITAAGQKTKLLSKDDLVEEDEEKEEEDEKKEAEKRAEELKKGDK
jgi:hypothetical protein